jgi:thiol-disulfide isomerase/thioredoxin
MAYQADDAIKQAADEHMKQAYEIFVSGKNLEGALDHIQQAKELVGLTIGIATAESQALATLGRYDEARAVLDEAMPMAKNDEERSYIFYSEGMVLKTQAFKAQDQTALSEAISAYQKSAEINPKSPAVLENAALLAQIGQKENALNYLKFFDQHQKAGARPEMLRLAQQIRNSLQPQDYWSQDVNIVDFEGKKLDMSQYKGKVVLVDVWATWCKPCVMATPHLIEISNQFPDEDFVLVGISADRTQKLAERYVEKNKIPYPSYWDKGGREAGMKYGVTGYPTFVLLDQQGKEIWRQSGWSMKMKETLISNITQMIETGKTAP